MKWNASVNFHCRRVSPPVAARRLALPNHRKDQIALDTEVVCSTMSAQQRQRKPAIPVRRPWQSKNGAPGLVPNCQYEVLTPVPLSVDATLNVQGKRPCLAFIFISYSGSTSVQQRSLATLPQQEKLSC